MLSDQNFIMQSPLPALRVYLTFEFLFTAVYWLFIQDDYNVKIPNIRYPKYFARNVNRESSADSINL